MECDNTSIGSIKAADAAEYTFPAYLAVKKAAVFVERQPNEKWLAHYVVLGNKAPAA